MSRGGGVRGTPQHPTATAAACLSFPSGVDTGGLLPAGHVLSRENMEEIVRLAAEENLLLLADEVGAGRGRGVSVPPTPSPP